MIEMYVTLVINKKRTCDSTNKEVPMVPKIYLEQVKDELNRRGYDGNGNKMS